MKLNIWRPHPKQEMALRRNEFEVLFGGARGGGKTDAGLVWLTEFFDHPRFRALVIRRNADDLSDWVDRAARFYAGLGAEIVYRPAIIRFPSGATIRTGHLKDEQAYTKYQGHEYQRILIEELTQIPDEKRYLQLISSCRSTVPEITPQVFLTTNPGGVGHNWVKRRFVDPSPPMVPFISEGRSRIYIPATIDDNPTLMETDQEYIKTLDQLKNVDLETYKAWRFGNWSVFVGQFFGEWSDKHITIFKPVQNSIYMAGMDWGYSNPFVLLLGCFFEVSHPRGKFYRCVILDEVVGKEKTAREWKDFLRIRLSPYRLSAIYADPSMFNRASDGSVAIAETFREDFPIKPAGNNRIVGAQIVKNWLALAPDGFPYLQVTQNCRYLIQTLPSLVRDEDNPEDVNTEGEDHAYDALRYLLGGFKEGEIGIIETKTNPKTYFFDLSKFK